MRSAIGEGMTQINSLRHGTWASTSWLRQRSRALVRPLAISVTVGACYFVAARFGLAMLTAADDVAVFWPAAGISAGALIALGPGTRAPVLSGTVAATIAANLLAGRNIAATFVFALCTAAEAIIAAWLIQRHTRATFNLEALRRVLGLFTAAVIASAVSGVGVSIGFVLLHGSTAPILTTWSNWFVSDALGIIIV